MSVFFNGRLLTTPSVESAIYDAGLATAYPGRANNVVAIIGTSEGGIPKQPMFFDSPVIARRSLRSGDLLRAVEMAFNPSAETGSPSRVAVVRVEEAIQSGLTLLDGNGNPVIALQSADYGAHTNGIRVTVESGSQAGKRVTVQHDNQYFTKDNLTRTPLTVRYSGIEATATVSVSATQVILRAPADTASPVALNLVSYRSIRELCDAINSQPGFSAVAQIPSALAQGVLDGFEPTSCKSVDLPLKADLQVVVDWFNTAARDMVIATRGATSLFTVQYTGEGTTATLTITDTKVSLKVDSDAPTEITVASHPTVTSLVAAIDAVTDFTATAVQGDMVPSNNLGLMDVVPCKTSAITVHALQGAPVNRTGTYMTGGGNGPAPVNQDWQDAFDALQAADVQWIVPISSNEYIWYMADAHVQFMSGPGKMERRCFVGGDIISGSLQQGISDAQDAAIALNSDRTALVFPPILAYTDDGVLTAMPAYFLAAQVAGGFAAMNFGNTMTNKTLKLQGLDPVVSNIYDSDTLINSGVCGIRKTQRGYIVSKAVTTWLSNDNYNRVEISTGVALDYVARTVREALEIFVGRKASPITLFEAISTTDSVLRELARPEPVGVGVIVGDEANPAYKNITAEIQGDILRVWFECSPVIPINFVLIGIYAKAYSGSASAVVKAG
jgi:hypothetical protein